MSDDRRDPDLDLDLDEDPYRPPEASPPEDDDLLYRPDLTNTAVWMAALLNLLLLGGVGYLLLGQRRKALLATLATLLLSCIGVGAFIPWITAADALVTGQKLRRGEGVRPTQLF